MVQIVVIVALAAAAAVHTANGLQCYHYQISDPTPSTSYLMKLKGVKQKLAQIFVRLRLVTVVYTKYCKLETHYA